MDSRTWVHILKLIVATLKQQISSLQELETVYNCMSTKEL